MGRDPALMLLALLTGLTALAPGDVAWAPPLDPVRVEKIEGGFAIVRPGQLVLEVDERGRIRALPPSSFANETLKIAVSELEREPPTKTSLRMRAVAEKDPAKKKALLVRALALDPLDDALAQEAGEKPAVAAAQVTRADLVYGCRGNLSRAVLVEGDAALTSTVDNACAVRVEMRPPCAPDIDDTGLAAADAAALRAAADEQFAHVKAAHGKRRARLSTYGAFGPGLRLVVQGGGSLWLSSSLLSLESCDCDVSVARALGDDARRIVLPKLARPAVVYVKVPRYLGALHRIGSERPGAAGAISYSDAFSAEPDDERPGLEVFSAPEGCDCAECG